MSKIISETEIFTKFLIEFDLSQVSDSEISYAKLLILDLLGCAIGGLGSKESTCAELACSSMNNDVGNASMWGTGKKVSLKDAALFNGVISHTLELDDFLGIDHTGAVVIPTLFALMDDTASFDEKKFLESMFVAYEFGKRMLDTAGGYRVHNNTGWHTTGTLGSYVSAVAASKYLGLDSEQVISAIGLAGSFTGGTWAFNYDGSMSKRYHPGKAAETGLSAAYFAKTGFTGPKYVLEAEWGGYFSLYAANNKNDTSSLFSSLGQDLKLKLTGIKPYACCRGNHSAIDAIFKIKEQKSSFSYNDIESIVVRCSIGQYKQLGNTTPNSTIEAQLSMPYAIACALMHDKVGNDKFLNPFLSDASLRRICGSVTILPQENWVAGVEPEIIVSLKDGSIFKEQVEIAVGDPRNPMTQDAVIEKFISLTKHKLSKEQEDVFVGYALGGVNGASLKDVRDILSLKL